MLCRLTPWDRRVAASIDPGRVREFFETDEPRPGLKAAARSGVEWILTARPRPRGSWIAVVTTDGGEWIVFLPSGTDAEELREYYADPVGYDATHPHAGERLLLLDDVPRELADPSPVPRALVASVDPS